MNKRQLLLALLPFLWQTGTLAEPPVAPRVAQEMQIADPYAVGPARLGQTEDELFAILGEPQEKTPVQLEPATGLFKKQWIYAEKGIGVIFAAQEEGGPFELDTIMLEEPSTWEAVNGLRIGMDSARAQSILKALQREGVSDFGDHTEEKYGVLFEDTYTVLAVGVIDGKVKHLYLGPGPE